MKKKVPRLTIDVGRQEVFVGRREVHLTHKEFNVLKALHVCKTILSREDLLRTVWGIDESMDVDTRVVDQNIARLRRKLKQPYIVTVPHRGYKIAV